MEIVEYNQFRARIAVIADACDFIPNVTTKEGYEKSRRVALDVGKVLTALEKSRAGLKADVLESGRQIDGQAKTLKEELAAIQEPHKAAYQKLDQEKKERKQKRLDELQSRVDYIARLPMLMLDADSESVKAAMQDLHKEECLDFYEMTSGALQARKASIDALADMFSKKLKQEADTAELAALRAESEAKAAEESKADIADAAVAAERKMRAEQTSIEAAANLSRLADNEHISKINLEIENKLMQYGLSTAQSTGLIRDIASGDFPHVTINY